MPFFYPPVDLTTELTTADNIHTFCINKDTVTMYRGDVVYLSGAQGDLPAIKLASNTADLTSAKTFGIVNQTIAPNGTGYVVNKGEVTNLNLGGFTTGDILWLDSVAGDFTNVKPVAPQHLVFIGVVLRANAGNGMVYVSPQNGYELDELHNVKINMPSANDVLAWDATQNLWVDMQAPVPDALRRHFHMADGAVDIYPRMFASTTTTLTSGRVQLMFFTPTRNMTVTRFAASTASVAASGLTLARFGLYTWDGTTATLVARSANNTALFGSTFTTSEALFDTTGGYPASYTLQAGTRYIVGLVCVGTTMPALVSNVTGIAVSVQEPRINARKNAQTDIPTSITTFDTGEASSIHVRLS